MTAINKTLAAANESKYGKKEKDVISQSYDMNKGLGDFWCGQNAIKYIRRFMDPNSIKKGNPVDLEKARDYLQRMQEMNPISDEHKLL